MTNIYIRNGNLQHKSKVHFLELDTTEEEKMPYQGQQQNVQNTLKPKYH